ncbi:sigma-54-dependent transcriptional regulator [Hornefia butyriciproducens]|uniref:sigma-54-dependent transcriptional regulator n=1 Tax=Hornefia butyriciproducens TaxID=2652293 RepID=UPI003F8BDDF6
MKSQKARVLIVDDEQDSLNTMQLILESEGYTVRTATSAEEAISVLEEIFYPIVVTDVMMNGMDGMGLLAFLRKKFHDEIKIIMVTGYGSIQTAVETMKMGASDYFVKGGSPRELIEKVNFANDVVFRKSGKSDLEDEIIVNSESSKMKHVWGLVNAIAESNSNVLIIGESGTGKEFLAKKIHTLSSRKEKKFVPINCQSFSQNLIESELFGHEKGAYTGALNRRIGKIEECLGGTLFLDEIGDIQLSTQIKLLRVLESRRIERVGGNKFIDVDFRMISATNQDLEMKMRRGEFREDFFYRINTFQIVVPPLRERREDLPIFIKFFIEKFSREIGKNITRIDDELKDYLLRYDYPGNIRELRNIIESLVVLAENDGILRMQKNLAKKQTFDIPDNGASEVMRPYKDMKEDFERQYFNAVLKQTGGNVSQAAKVMGLSRRQLYYKMKELGIHNLWNDDK